MLVLFCRENPNIAKIFADVWDQLMPIAREELK